MIVRQRTTARTSILRRGVEDASNEPPPPPPKTRRLCRPPPRLPVRMVSLFQMLVVMLLVGEAWALAPQHRPTKLPRATTTTTTTTSTCTATTTALSMSDRTTSGDDNNSDDDDEVLKLIGKRSQIKRKKKEGDGGDSLTDAAALEPMVDLDLDSLPAFKTERPVRSSSRRSPDDESATDSKKQPPEKQQAPIIDYMADYDDENEWHIPNRFVASSAAWGDVNQNFVLTSPSSSSSKLTKRMQKAGKFVAGDVVLAVTGELWPGGIVAVETCPAYGNASRRRQQSALDLVKQCLEQPKNNNDDSSLPEPQLVVQMDPSLSTKVRALLRPGRTMVSSLEETLRVLDESSVTLFVAPHVPYTPTRLLAAGLASQIESGQADYVGVSGIRSASTLRRLCRHLEARDCTLTAAAFPFSLTHPQQRKIQDLMAACKLLRVVPLVLDPLDGGLASGVYTATNPSGGQQQQQSATTTTTKFRFAQLEKLQPLHSVLETVAERVQTRVRRQLRDTQERYKSKYGPPPQINTDITTTQVALQWVIAKGGVPVTPVNNPAQAKEVLGCLGWTLTDDDVSQLDAAAALCRL